MSRKKGSEKTGGRTKGTPNKTSGRIREAISIALDNYYNSKKFAQDMKELDPKDRLAAMEKLASYVAPKLQATTLDFTNDNKKTIEDKLIEMSADE